MRAAAKWTAVLVAVGVVVWLVWPQTEVRIGVLEVSGRVEGDQVAIGAKLGGRIIRLPLREGDTLKEGELVADLSSEQVRARVEQADHELHTAREEVVQALARIDSLDQEIRTRETAVELAGQESKARISEAQAALQAAHARFPEAAAELERAKKDFERYRSLLAKGLIAPQQLDQARTMHESAKASEEVARKRIAQAEANLNLARTTAIAVELRKRELEQTRKQRREAVEASQAAKARVQSLQARKAEAQADLNDTRVVAPFDGTVLEKLVQQGQVVAAGTPLVTFVDLSKLYVKVYVPEKEIAKVRLGNSARVYVDAFPDRFFMATVSEVSQQAEFTPRDVHMKDERVKLVFAVKLALDNPQGFLKPGMPADARIQWRAEALWGDGFG